MMPTPNSKGLSPSPTIPSARASPRTPSKPSLKSWKSPSSNTMPYEVGQLQPRGCSWPSDLFASEQRHYWCKHLHMRVRNDVIRESIQFAPPPHILSNLVSGANKNGG